MNRKSVPKMDGNHKMDQSLNNSHRLRPNINMSSSINNSYSHKMMNSFISVNNSSTSFNLDTKTRFNNFYDPRNVMRIDDFRTHRQ